MRRVIQFAKWYIGSAVVLGIGGAIILTATLPQEVVIDRIIVPICVQAPDVCRQLFVP